MGLWNLKDGWKNFENQENKKLTLFLYRRNFVYLQTEASIARNLEVYFNGAESILLRSWKYTLTKVGILTAIFKTIVLTFKTY